MLRHQRFPTDITDQSRKRSNPRTKFRRNLSEKPKQDKKPKQDECHLDGSHGGTDSPDQEHFIRRRCFDPT